MKIGIVSDLHLEHSNLKMNVDHVDILILAGDISADPMLLPQFIERNLPTDIPILYVLGNHEYEDKIYENVKAQYNNAIKSFPNIKILQNESYIYNNVKFIGTTLWTDFIGEGQTLYQPNKQWAEKNVADFYYTRTRDANTGKIRRITTDDMEKWSQEAQKFLKYELTQNYFEGEKVVITHFAPHQNSVHQKFKNSLSAYWVNNLEHLMGFSEYWIHGHTHDSFQYTIEGTNIICNPRGVSHIYDIHQNLNFDPKFYINIPEPAAIKHYKP